MAHSTANDDGRLALPSINVDVSVSDTTSNSTSANDADMHQPDNNNEAISPLPTPTTSHAHSPSQLSTPAFGRDRSLSGSTAHTAQSDSPLLKPPHSSGTVSSRASSAFGDEERQDALKPDPGSEKDFTVQDNKFAFSPGQLNKLLNPKSLAAFSALGGIRGIEHGLRTNIDSGLSSVMAQVLAMPKQMTLHRHPPTAQQALSPTVSASSATMLCPRRRLHLY
jgi:hypothetical protein